MNKAEKFIQEWTMNCSNVSLHIGEYYEWITPLQAKEAVKIAREEIVNEVCDYIKGNLYKHLYVCDGEAGFPTFQFIEDLKKHLEGKL